MSCTTYLTIRGYHFLWFHGIWRPFFYSSVSSTSANASSENRVGAGRSQRAYLALESLIVCDSNRGIKSVSHYRYGWTGWEFLASRQIAGVTTNWLKTWVRLRHQLVEPPERGINLLTNYLIGMAKVFLITTTPIAALFRLLTVWADRWLVMLSCKEIPKSELKFFLAALDRDVAESHYKYMYHYFSKFGYPIKHPIR